MDPSPSIESYMTRSPFTIGRAQTLEAAYSLMNEHGIRHLPVLHDGKLVGMLSMREAQLVTALRDMDPALILVDIAMRRDTYWVPPDRPLQEVAAEMAARKVGSAVVMQGAEVLGVFTTTDALHALSELLAAKA